MAEQAQFFATTPKGMEALLAQELAGLGASSPEVGRAGVSFAGSLETAYRVCLWSRIANRVLLPLKTFPAPTPEKLYGGVKSIRWSEHLTPQMTLAVDFSSSQSMITHTQFGALKVKDAIVDQLRSVHGERPSVDVEIPDLRVNVYLMKDQATVSIDLSGESLHQRGYREEAMEAPLKENLAAALLMQAGWPKRSREEWVLVDPMCGAGTLPIEAALIAADAAPGLTRTRFGFLGWLKHDAGVWEGLLTEAKKRVIRDPRKLPTIIGYDVNPRAVRTAISNVERAGLRGMVHIEKKELSKVTSVAPVGIVIVNPPYGERIGDVEGLRGLYKQIGDIMKNQFKGWEGYIFTGSPDLMRSVGLRVSRKNVFFNGAIECRLLKYDLY